jgi:hypothetical protein
MKGTGLNTLLLTCLHLKMSEVFTTYSVISFRPTQHVNYFYCIFLSILFVTLFVKVEILVDVHSFINNNLPSFSFLLVSLPLNILHKTKYKPN